MARTIDLRCTDKRLAAYDRFYDTPEDDQLTSTTREDLANLASPAPSLTSDGRLDARPNNPYDTPVVDDDLPTLPFRQRAVIDAILSDVPNNAPAYLRRCLENYRDELLIRGVQPILGILKDMADISRAAVKSDLSEAVQSDWLSPGLQTAFDRFFDNRNMFLDHFPLDKERESLYSRTLVDEQAAVGARLHQPFAQAAGAAKKANLAGVTTDDFLKIMSGMSDFAQIVASQPGPQIAEPNRDRVTHKKRMILSAFGFLERAYNILGSSATLLSKPEGNILLGALHNVGTYLATLIRF